MKGPFERWEHMAQDVRWKQRLDSYRQSLENLDEVHARWLDQQLDRIELQAMVKSFELCYESAWTLLKAWYQYQGEAGINGPRDAFRRAFRDGLVEEGHGWMEMIETRNRAVHTYNESAAREVAEVVGSRYHELFHQLLDTMSELEAREAGDA